MKRIAISLVIVFLTCQVSYAVCPYERLMQRVENRQELTQEDVDEILYELIDSIDSIEPNQEGCLYFILMAVAANIIGDQLMILFTSFAVILCLGG
jgi:hypothetical protein